MCVCVCARVCGCLCACCVDVDTYGCWPLGGTQAGMRGSGLCLGDGLFNQAHGLGKVLVRVRRITARVRGVRVGD